MSYDEITFLSEQTLTDTYRYKSIIYCLCESIQKLPLLAVFH